MSTLKIEDQKKKSLNLVLLALFAGVIVVMAFVPFVGYIPLGFTRATIIHVPVIIGSIFLGPKNGAILGGVFGLTSVINNTINPTPASFVFSPFYELGDVHGGISSLIVAMVPRILVGVVPYFVFKFVVERVDNPSSIRTSVGLALSGIAGALTNTLLVMNLIFLLFRDNYASINKIDVSVLYKFIAGIIAVNGVPEAIVAGIIVLGLGKVLLKNNLKQV